MPRAQERPTPSARLGPSLEALASAANKYSADGPSSADAPSSTLPPSDAPASSDALPGLSPGGGSQATGLGATAAVAGRGPSGGLLLPPPPAFGSAPAMSNSHSLSEYEMVRKD